MLYNHSLFIKSERSFVSLLKKAFTYSEKSEKDRTDYIEKRAIIPTQKRVYIDESDVT